MFDASLKCDMITINWTSLPDDPCPIIGYIISISDVPMLLDASQTNFTHPISDSDCGNIFTISVNGVSAAGTGGTSTLSLPITCTREETKISLTFF